MSDANVSSSLSEKRKVGIPLFIGIFLLPYIFVWFLLKKGYSTKSRVIGFSWFAFIIIMFCVSTNTSEQEDTKVVTTSKDTSTSISSQEIGYSSGMYKIGSDLPEGEYVLLGSSAYFQIAKDSTGTLDSIISNDNFSNRSIITVSNGQYLTFNGDRIIPINETKPAEPKNGFLPEGMYKVGFDIDPGEYSVTSESSGYLEVTTNSRHVLDDIITNDNFNGNRYITVNEGQYIKISNATIKVPLK